MTKIQKISHKVTLGHILLQIQHSLKVILLTFLSFILLEYSCQFSLMTCSCQENMIK